MATTTLYTHISLDQTIGALEIGSLFSVFLFGILTLQTYNYYYTFREDGWKTKTLVSFWCYSFVPTPFSILARLLLSGASLQVSVIRAVSDHSFRILEAGHTSAISFEIYRVSIRYYGKPQLLGKFVGIGATTSMAGAISFLVQVLSTPSTVFCPQLISMNSTSTELLFHPSLEASTHSLLLPWTILHFHILPQICRDRLSHIWGDDSFRSWTLPQTQRLAYFSDSHSKCCNWRDHRGLDDLLPLSSKREVHEAVRQF